MAYKALYREWRPQSFKGLVGQTHITQTLQNAVKGNRIAHAYLFTGPRGTGKTSTAKILAKAVNCLSIEEGQPCNLCSNCISINNGHSLDVLEIDAASNRGIDEIRDIRERVNFVPSQGKYKVYIVDEVHMLTTEAFNALLKTLEEPPAHVIFILATTEPQKIPATILSRCQRYDFRKIAPREMEMRLQEILADSRVKAEEGVIPLIIKKAEGGLRDGISILDQCMSFSPDYISLATAYEVLGQVKSDTLFEISQAIVDNNPACLLLKTNELLREGVEPGQLMKDLLEHFRNMVLLLVCGADSQLVLLGEEEKELILAQGKTLGLLWLTQTISQLAKLDNESRWRQNMRIVLETFLINLLYQDKSEFLVEKGGNQISVVAGEVKLQQGKEEVQDTQVQKRTSGKKDNKKTSQLEDIPGDNNSSVDINLVRGKWQEIMEEVKGFKKMVHAFLTECNPKAVSDGRLELIFKSGYTFHKEKIEEPENRKMVEGIIEKLLGTRLTLLCTMEDEEENSTKDPVQKAIDLFGADVVIIKD